MTAVIRSNIAPASLKHPYACAALAHLDRHPEQHCSGLIEARLREQLHCTFFGVIRSNIAPASLKPKSHRDRRPTGSLSTVIRSNIAPASLKPARPVECP